eukprot:TRINITY_DN659_c0_g1_i3.p1 TRINITY_DN659_c0_g1~~TRINITY_DN659_c0_g1_i3.p1  ORF type:complete len:676 (-),score=134.72 TRINITY_DN659_c0_g1_i3:181-2208(-)
MMKCCSWLLLVLLINQSLSQYWSLHSTSLPSPNHDFWTYYKTVNHPSDPDSILVWGGFLNDNQTTMQNILWKYNVVEDEWTYLTGNQTNNRTDTTLHYPGGTKNPGIVVASENSIIMFGGARDNYDSYGTVWLYTIDDNHWKLLGDQNILTKRIATATHPGGWDKFGMTMESDDSFLIFGGIGVGTRISNNVWRFNISTETWEHLKGDIMNEQIESPSPNLIPQSMYGSVIMMDSDDSFLMFGGVGPTGYSSTLWRFSISNNSWSIVSRNPNGETDDTLPYPPANMGSTMFFDSDDSLLVTGYHSNYMNIWRYSLISHSWELIYQADELSANYGENGHPAYIFFEDLVMVTLDTLVLFSYNDKEPYKYTNKSDIWKFHLNNTSEDCWDKLLYSNRFLALCKDYQTTTYDETTTNDELTTTDKNGDTTTVDHRDDSSSSTMYEQSEFDNDSTTISETFELESDIVIGSGFEEEQIVVGGGSVLIVDQVDSQFVVISISDSSGEFVDSSAVSIDLIIQDSGVGIVNSQITIENILTLNNSSLVISSGSYLQVDGCITVHNSTISVQIDDAVVNEGKPFLKAVSCDGTPLQVEIKDNDGCHSVQRDGSEYSILFICQESNVLTILLVVGAAVIVSIICICIYAYTTIRRRNALKKLKTKMKNRADSEVDIVALQLESV